MLDREKWRCGRKLHLSPAAGEPGAGLVRTLGMAARGHDTDGRGAARQEDAALLAQVEDGDERALEALYSRYGGACYGLARRIIGDAQLAEDVIQQVFLALWQKRGYDPARGAVSTWLMSITHHKAVDALRREGRRRAKVLNEQTLIERELDEPGPADQAWLSIRAERTRWALRELGGEHREVLLLAYYGGYTQREIAEMTGIPLGTVKSRTAAAMRRLHDLLRGELDTEQGSSR